MREKRDLTVYRVKYICYENRRVVVGKQISRRGQTPGKKQNTGF